MSNERHAFVLRLWTEAAADTAEERPLSLRGSLHAVADGEVVYFNSLDDLPQLLEQMVAQTSSDDAAPPSP